MVALGKVGAGCRAEIDAEAQQLCVTRNTDDGQCWSSRDQLNSLHPASSSIVFNAFGRLFGTSASAVGTFSLSGQFWSSLLRDKTLTTPASGLRASRAAPCELAEFGHMRVRVRVLAVLWVVVGGEARGRKRAGRTAVRSRDDTPPYPCPPPCPACLLYCATQPRLPPALSAITVCIT